MGTRKTQKIQRAIVGVSKDDILKKRNQKPEVRAAAREAALKEAKDRSKAKRDARKKSGAAKKGGFVKNVSVLASALVTVVLSKRRRLLGEFDTLTDFVPVSIFS